MVSVDTYYFDDYTQKYGFQKVCLQLQLPSSHQSSAVHDHNMPPAKRIRLSKREPTPPSSHSGEESGSEDDDWAAERAARSGGGQQAGLVQEDEEEDEEEDGVAQFEDDDEELDYSSDEDEEVSLGLRMVMLLEKYASSQNLVFRFVGFFGET